MGINLHVKGKTHSISVVLCGDDTKQWSFGLTTLESLSIL